MKTKLNFVDAQEMHRQYPKTFEVPSLSRLAMLKVGEFVKVSHNDERFWVSVTKIDGEKVCGKVDNDLICDQPFQFGDETEFEKRHIYSVYQE